MNLYVLISCILSCDNRCVGYFLLKTVFDNMMESVTTRMLCDLCDPIWIQQTMTLAGVFLLRSIEFLLNVFVMSPLLLRRFVVQNTC